jgi:hypothetical protein
MKAGSKVQESSRHSELVGSKKDEYLEAKSDSIPYIERLQYHTVGAHFKQSPTQKSKVSSYVCLELGI